MVETPTSRFNMWNTEEPSVSGSFVDYESYSVLAQGVGGAIWPYHYNAYLLRQNKRKENEHISKSLILGTNAKASYRFIGDFSNRYEHDMSQDVFNTSGPDTDPLSFTFNSNRKTGKSGTESYDVDNNVLPGSPYDENKIEHGYDSIRASIDSRIAHDINVVVTAHSIST
jgi:hypothetical protein